MNKLVLEGTIVSELISKHTFAGYTYTKFKMKVEDDRGKTQIIPCELYGDIAEFASLNYRKGDTVSGVGTINVREYLNSLGHRQTVCTAVLRRCSLIREENVKWEIETL